MKIVETPEQLAAKLNYDPLNGELTWKGSGKIAGWISNGYKRVGKHSVYAHRIAYFIMTGKWPKEVDHINRNKLDNRWENLRDCSHKQNTRNLSKRSSKTGVRGVSQHPNGWDIRVGKSFRSFTTDFEKACELAQKKREEIYGEFSGEC